MFGTSGIRGPVGEVVTAELALSLGRALASEGYRDVLVGRDVRDSGDLLVDAVCVGLRECGASVTRTGVASTPTIARGVGWLDADAGVAITASHNPPADNGFKLWLPSGQAFDEARQAAIADRIQSETYALESAQNLGPQRVESSIRTRHVRTLADSVETVERLDVVVDVGTGTGGITVDSLRALDCAVTALNAQPDGQFPGRPSEPSKEHCRDLRLMTGDTDADLGLAHDGDADRLMAVASDGTFLSGDQLLTVFARETASAGDSVAVPLNTSLLVEDALDEIGVSVAYTRVGDVFVAERVREPGVVFGGEPSGVWIWPSETLCPDGPQAACRLVEIVSSRGDLGELIDGLEPYPIHRKSFPVDRKDRTTAAIDRLVSNRYDTIDNRDGVRVDAGDGWFLIRPSGTEPLVRVTAEARTTDRAKQLFEDAKGIVDEAR